jgi:hypothetical protein
VEEEARKRILWKIVKFSSCFTLKATMSEEEAANGELMWCKIERMAM